MEKTLKITYRKKKKQHLKHAEYYEWTVNDYVIVASVIVITIRNSINCAAVIKTFNLCFYSQIKFDQCRYIELIK